MNAFTRTLGRLLPAAARTYALQAADCRARFAAAPSRVSLARWYPRWRRSLANGRDAIADRRPWITYGALEFLERELSREHRVFEWGSGGSSLYFAARARSVRSIEHDATWFARVAAEADRLVLRCWSGSVIAPESAQVATADPSDWRAYASASPEFAAYRFHAYAAAIDVEPEASLDLVMIDGRARPSCLAHAVAKVRPGGLIVVDNTERDYYEPAMRALCGGFTRRDFPGPIAYLREFVCTTVLRRPSP